MVTRNSVTSEAVDEPVVDDEDDTDQGRGREDAVEQHAGAATDAGLDPHHGREPLVHLTGELGAPAQHVGLTETGAEVVAGGDALLHRGGVVGPRHLLDHLELGELRQHPPDHEQRGEPGDREQEERRPPREAGHQPQRAGRHGGAQRHPDALPEQGADLVGVVVDAVEHLADRLLAQLRERLSHGGVEEVGP